MVQVKIQVSDAFCSQLMINSQTGMAWDNAGFQATTPLIGQYFGNLAALRYMTHHQTPDSAPTLWQN